MIVEKRYFEWCIIIRYSLSVIRYFIFSYLLYTSNDDWSSSAPGGRSFQRLALCSMSTAAPSYNISLLFCLIWSGVRLTWGENQSLSSDLLELTRFSRFGHTTTPLIVNPPSWHRFLLKSVLDLLSPSYHLLVMKIPLTTCLWCLPSRVVRLWFIPASTPSGVHPLLLSSNLIVPLGTMNSPLDATSPLTIRLPCWTMMVNGQLCWNFSSTIKDSVDARLNTRIALPGTFLTLILLLERLDPFRIAIPALLRLMVWASVLYLSTNLFVRLLIAVPPSYDERLILLSLVRSLALDRLVPNRS